MKKRLLAALVGAAAIAAIFTPATAQATPTIEVGPGASYTPYPEVEGSCAIAAVGYDNQDRLVALTAGHCHQQSGKAVYKVGEAEAGPIGWETGVFVKPPTGEVGGASLDYAVLLLDETKVIPSAYSETTDAHVVSTGDATLWQNGCKHGPATGKTCGIIGVVGSQWLRNWATMGPGDSGGPIVVGTKLVGISIGMVADQPPFVFAKIGPVLADINAKAGVGAGFVPVV